MTQGAPAWGCRRYSQRPAMDIKQLTPDALTELADRLHHAQSLVRFVDGKLIIELTDHTGQVLSLDEVRRRLSTLANDMYSTAGLIKAASVAQGPNRN
jgi:hypothetical protein